MAVFSDTRPLLTRWLDRRPKTAGANKYFRGLAVHHHVSLEDIRLELTIRCLHRVAAVVPKLWTLTAN